MKKKIISSLLSAITVFTMFISPMSVKADGLQNVGDTANSTSTATFSVSADDIGGVTVSVPESITLTYDSTDKKYANSTSDKVYVYGNLATGRHITVATPTSTSFSHKTDDTAPDMTGAVTFGTDGTATWTNAQILAGRTIEANRVGNSIGVQVTDLTNIRLGAYESTMTFTATTVAD